MSTLQSELPVGRPPDLLSSSNQVALYCSVMPTCWSGEGPPSPPCSRQSAVSCGTHYQVSMCRYLETEFWPCRSLWGHSKLNKYQGAMMMIWRRQVDVGVEVEFTARYTNSGGGSRWFRWAGKADQKTEQRKDTGYETLLLRVSGVFVTESKSCPSATPRLSPETDSQEAFHWINTQKCLILKCRWLWKGARKLNRSLHIWGIQVSEQSLKSSDLIANSWTCLKGLFTLKREPASSEKLTGLQ